MGQLKTLPTSEYSITQSNILAKIALHLGGVVAEKLIFNEITSNAEDDLHHATQLATNMVVRWGMSSSFGLTSIDEDSITVSKTELRDSEVCITMQCCS